MKSSMSKISFRDKMLSCEIPPRLSGQVMTIVNKKTNT